MNVNESASDTESLVSIYMYVNSKSIQDLRRDAMYKVHIK